MIDQREYVEKMGWQGKGMRCCSTSISQCSSQAHWSTTNSQHCKKQGKHNHTPDWSIINLVFIEGAVVCEFTTIIAAADMILGADVGFEQLHY